MNDPDIYLSCWLMCIYQTVTPRICLLLCSLLKGLCDACCWRQIDSFSGRWTRGNLEWSGGVTSVSNVSLVKAGVRIDAVTYSTWEGGRCEMSVVVIADWRKVKRGVVENGPRKEGGKKYGGICKRRHAHRKKKKSRSSLKCVRDVTEHINTRQARGQWLVAGHTVSMNRPALCFFCMWAFLSLISLGKQNGISFFCFCSVKSNTIIINEDSDSGIYSLHTLPLKACLTHFIWVITVLY